MNQNIIRKSSRFDLLTDLGVKVKNLICCLFIASIFLLITDVVYLQKKCIKINNTQIPELSLSNKINTGSFCLTSQIISNIYNSLIVSIIMILSLEISLRKDTVEEIKQIFTSSQATKCLKSFHLNKNVCSSLISAKIRNIKIEEEVKILSLTKDISILTNIDLATIKEKILKGSKFKILLLYPHSDNRLLYCLQNTHQSLRHIKGSIDGDLLFFRSIAESLNKCSDIEGEIEVRLQKDIYSSICYFSIKDNRCPKDFMAFVWMYLFDERGLKHPSFEILDEQLLEDTEQHFKYLWNKSQSILRYNNNTKTNRLNELANPNNEQQS